MHNVSKLVRNFENDMEDGGEQRNCLSCTAFHKSWLEDIIRELIEGHCSDNVKWKAWKKDLSFSPVQTQDYSVLDIEVSG